MQTRTPVRRPADPADDRRPPAGRRWRDLGAGVGLPLLGVLAALAGWWLGTHLYNARTLFIPQPEEVYEQLVAHPGYFAEHAWVTLYQTLVGFGIATAAGLVIAVVLVSSRTLERAAMPLVIGLNAIPKVVFAPLLVVWLSYGNGPMIALAALIAFFPVVVATMAGLSATPAELGELAQSLSASRWRTFVKIRAPWALPQVFIGLKLAMTLALIGAVVAQLQTPTAGLGAAVSLARVTQPSVAFAAIVVLMVLSLVLFYGLVLLERVSVPWARQTTARR